MGEYLIRDRPELLTVFSIKFNEKLQEKYKIPSLDGEMVNLLPPGAYIPPKEDPIQPGEDWICEWWIKRGCFERGTKYHLKFKDNFARLSHYVIPQDTPELMMRLHYYFLGWTFQHDDVLDTLYDMKKGWGPVAAANKIFNAILRDEYGRTYQDNIPDVPDFPRFLPLCHVWRDFHALLHDQIEFYEAKNPPFLKYMQWYFDSYILSHGHRIDRRFSQDAGKFWLRFSTGWKPWIEVDLLIRGVFTPPAMRKDLYYILLRSTCEDVIGFTNDILGVSKDLGNDEMDTLVMFKHFEKGVPLTQAFKETLADLNSQIRDQMLLLKILRHTYPNDKHAEGTCKAIEEFIDGYMLWCATNVRYGGKTAVSYKVFDPITGKKSDYIPKKVNN